VGEDVVVPDNLLAGPPPTLLTDDPVVRTLLEAGEPPRRVAASYPESSFAWAALSDEAWAEQREIESYAFARVGYHRSLDALRRHGWKGHGPVPWSHEPNRGFLRCLASLQRAAAEIGETHEAERCAAFLADCDPQAAAAIASR
jgi:hypothetical protein